MAWFAEIQLVGYYNDLILLAFYVRQGQSHTKVGFLTLWTYFWKT